MKFEKINQYIKTLDHKWILEPAFKEQIYPELWIIKCDEIGEISFFLKTQLQLNENEYICTEIVSEAKIYNRNLKNPDQKIIENVCRNLNEILIK